MQKADEVTVARKEESFQVSQKTVPALDSRLTEILKAYARSIALYEEAKKILPAGASSNMRVHMHDPFPILFTRGKGSRVWDVDGNEYVDYQMAYGTLILGHSHTRIVEAIRQQLEKGTMLGTTTELEIEVARKVSEMVPCAEMVSFANTGTEATMEAIRIARAATGKDKIVKFEGHYHGHHDYVLFSVESPLAVAGLESAPHRLPYYPGIPEDIGRTVLVAPWNNMSALERLLKKHANDVAAVITEPVMASAGIVLPEAEYLKHLREITQKHDVLLIFDEVFTGFRIAKGGAQEYFNVKPDLACFAKAMGGGVPIAAVAGRRDVMEMIGPGKIGYGGTYNANPLVLAACKATLEELCTSDGAVFKHMTALGNKLREELQKILDKSGHDGIVQGIGPLLQLYFTRLKRISTYRQSVNCNFSKFKEFRDGMVQKGVYFHPDGTERLVLSAAHNYNDVEETLDKAEEVLRIMPKRVHRSFSFS